MHEVADSCQRASWCQCRKRGYLLDRTWRERQSSRELGGSALPDLFSKHCWLPSCREVTPSLLTTGILSRLICVCLAGEASLDSGRDRANMCQWMWGWKRCQAESYRHLSVSGGMNCREKGLAPFRVRRGREVSSVGCSEMCSGPCYLMPRAGLTQNSGL